MFDQQVIKKALEALGVRKNGILLVHSSYKRMGEIEGGLLAVLSALRDYMKDGLLLLPTHTWSYINTQTDTFDVLTSPSCVGAMTEVFRTQPGVYRSLHPTHSMAGLGKAAREFLAYDDENVQTPCHPNGPWGRLCTWDAQILMLGVTLSCCTYLHGVEEMACTPNRVALTAVDQYVIGYDRVRRLVPSYRHCYGSSDQFPRVHNALIAQNVMREGMVCAAPSLLIDARGAARVVTPMLQEKPELFDR